MNNKKSRTARSAAVVLAVVGIAGLSMAAATQLDMSWNGEFQAGRTTVTADCQPGDQKIGVAFSDPVASTGGTLPWSIGKLEFSGINTDCEGSRYKVDYKVTASSQWVSLADGTNLALDSGVLAINLGSVDPQKIAEVALTILS